LIGVQYLRNESGSSINSSDELKEFIDVEGGSDDFSDIDVTKNYI